MYRYRNNYIHIHTYKYMSNTWVLPTCQAKGLKRAREPKGAVDPPAKKGKTPEGPAKSSTASAASGEFKGYSLKEIPKEACSKEWRCSWLHVEGFQQCRPSLVTSLFLLQHQHEKSVIIFEKYKERLFCCHEFVVKPFMIWFPKSMRSTSWHKHPAVLRHILAWGNRVPAEEQSFCREEEGWECPGGSPKWVGPIHLVKAWRAPWSMEESKGSCFLATCHVGVFGTTLHIQ